MNFQEWLRKQNYYVDFHTRFKIHPDKAYGTDLPFYCELIDDAGQCMSVRVQEDGMSRSLTGEGNTLQSAFFNLIRKIEAIGQKCGTIGTTNRKTSVIPDRFSFNSMDFPPAPNNGIQLSDWIVVDGYCAMRVIEGFNPEDLNNRVAFIEKTPRVRIKEGEEFSDWDYLNWLSGPKGSGCGSDESAERLQAYGFDPDSRKWCDEMLRALGYSF